MKLFSYFVTLATGQFHETKLVQTDMGTPLTDAIFKSLVSCHDWINQALVCDPPKSKISNYEFRFAKVAKDTAWHVFAIKNCNWPRMEEGAYIRNRRGTRRNQIDQSFSQSFENGLNAYIVKQLSGQVELKSALQAEGSGDDSSNNSDFPHSSIQNDTLLQIQSRSLLETPPLAQFTETDAKGKGKGKGKGNKSPKPPTIDQLASRCKTDMIKLWEREELNQCPKLGSWRRRMNGLIRTVQVMHNVCLNQVSMQSVGYY